jgi:hypothetical protein
LTTIAEQAFASCPITSVTIPSGVTSIGGEAFNYCFALKSAYFMGNCPTGSNIFINCGNNVGGFTFYYKESLGNTGFAGLGYTKVALDDIPPTASSKVVQCQERPREERR